MPCGRIRSCLAWALVLTTIPAAGAARADDYPSRPIQLIVPYAAGGGADSVARIVAKRVGETIGQPIVIENRGGAGSIIGTEFVNKADPTATRCCWANPGRFRSTRPSTRTCPMTR